MHIRHYQAGDEHDQAAIYNAGANGLPDFKAATAEDIRRRYQATDADPASKLYAVEGGRIVGYALLSNSGRISFPWCLAAHEEVRPSLLEATLSALRNRGVHEAWAAYRADWAPVLGFFREHDFLVAREMINYVAQLERLPEAVVPRGQALGPLARNQVRELLSLSRSLFRDEDVRGLEGFFWENPYLDPSALFALRDQMDGRLLGLALAVIHPAFAHPTQLDAAMPCFRLGALGTENERHKRVNGLFSCLFTSEPHAATLLAEATRRMRAAGLSHIAAQAPSDQPSLCAFYDQHFQRQGAFPIVSLPLVS